MENFKYNICYTYHMIEITYINFFKALSNDTRLGIVLCLKEKPMCVSEIVKKLGIEQSRVSHKLRCLEKNCFVSSERNGKQKIYRINRETISPMIDIIKKHVKQNKVQTC